MESQGIRLCFSAFRFIQNDIMIEGQQRHDRGFVTRRGMFGIIIY